MLATILGGWFALHREDRLHLILGFSAGAVLGVALFDLLPEAMDLATTRYAASTVALLIGVGFFAFTLLNRMIAAPPRIRCLGRNRRASTRSIRSREPLHPQLSRRSRHRPRVQGLDLGRPGRRRGRPRTRLLGRDQHGHRCPQEPRPADSSAEMAPAGRARAPAGSRLDVLLLTVASGSRPRTRALLRLLPLHRRSRPAPGEPSPASEATHGSPEHRRCGAHLDHDSPRSDLISAAASASRGSSVLLERLVSAPHAGSGQDAPKS